MSRIILACALAGILNAGSAGSIQAEPRLLERLSLV